MKRVIAVSDSHGAVTRLREAAELALSKGFIDVFVFLGDGLDDFEMVKPLLLRQQPGMKLIEVCGNNDFGSYAPQLNEFSLCGRSILAAHGHQYHVKLSLNRLSLAARERNASAVLYGHTHISRMEDAFGIWMINPGAICGGARAAPAYAEILINESGRILPNLVRWSGEAF